VVGRTPAITGVSGQWLNEIGRVAAIVGTYASLLVLLLAARIPWIEREIGQDRLLHWHRRIAPWALGLIGLHVVANTVGYALGARTGILSQLWEFLSATPWMLPALAGFVIMMVVGFSSARVARRRMKYETWWVVHLYAYIGVALAYLHQVLYGQTFVGHPWATRFWLGLYLLTVGSFLLFRVGMPVATNLRHQLRVSRVVRESADTVSVYITGRKLDRMAVRGGQFFNWRFAMPRMWWEAHAYSLSAAPNPHELRITVKDLGDHSSALARLRPGTRAFVEGPYGVFTADQCTSDRVVLVAGGVGVTPIRAILAELPATARVEVLYRAPRAEAVVLWQELDEIARTRPGTRVRYLVGNRRQFPLDARWLYTLVPWIQSADLYVCGPKDLNDSVAASARVLGIPAGRIHSEAFSF
jgi:predicted ferric reductase